MNAEKLFDEMKPFVDAACNKKDHSLVARAAQKLGFQDFPTTSTSQIFADLRYKDSAGCEVLLVAKWHDPSGPFQNLPDINRIRLTLRVPGQPSVEYTREYED